MERERLGADHTRIGAALAERWRIPSKLVGAIRSHHSPSASLPEGGADEMLARCVAFSSLAAAAASENEADACAGGGAFRRLCGDWLGLDREGVKEFVSDLKTGASEVTRHFELDTGAPLDVGSMLEEAKDRQLEIQLTQERENRTLQNQNTELQREKRIDGLTGAGNRGAFDEALESAFGSTQRGNEPFVLAFLDADHFKELNDTHGHQAGDEALVKLSRRLREIVPGEEGSPFGVYRYGGEEFAVLAPAGTLDAAADLGERLRRSVAETPFALPSLGEGRDPLRVTASVGIAHCDGESLETYGDAAAVLKAADEAVYRAKDDGRNVCRLHTPRGSWEDQRPPTGAPSEPGPDDGGHAPAPERRTLRVLIVDDDPLLQKLLQSAFERTGEAEARVVSSVTEAVKLLHYGEGGTRYTPHMVITDLNMPGHSGTKLLRFIRATEGLSTAPVLVLSGSEQPADIRACIDAGANAYIPKSAVSGDVAEAAKRIVGFWSYAIMAA